MSASDARDFSKLSIFSEPHPKSDVGTDVTVGGADYHSVLGGTECNYCYWEHLVFLGNDSRKTEDAKSVRNAIDSVVEDLWLNHPQGSQLEIYVGVTSDDKKQKYKKLEGKDIDPKTLDNPADYIKKKYFPSRHRRHSGKEDSATSKKENKLKNKSWYRFGSVAIACLVRTGPGKFSEPGVVNANYQSDADYVYDLEKMAHNYLHAHAKASKKDRKFGVNSTQQGREFTDWTQMKVLNQLKYIAGTAQADDPDMFFLYLFFAWY